MSGRRAIDRLDLLSSASQRAELVTFRIGEHMPWLGAGLAYIGSMSAGHDSPL
jgi:hypothetical protein